jgi:hypothetical protein
MEDDDSDFNADVDASAYVMVACLAPSLTSLVSDYGVDDPVVRDLLKGKSSQARAYELVKSTRLKDVQFRHQLYDGSVAAVSAADPMLEFAQAADKAARQARETMEEHDEVANKAYAEIAKAKLGLEGAQFAPDATFTLRLSYGTVGATRKMEKRSRHLRISPDCISGLINTKIARLSSCQPAG